jgi:hypothetical protein
MRIKSQNIYIRTPKTNYYIGSESFGKYMYSGLMSTRNKIVSNTGSISVRQKFVIIRKNKEDY